MRLHDYSTGKLMLITQILSYLCDNDEIGCRGLSLAHVRQCDLHASR